MACGPAGAVGAWPYYSRHRADTPPQISDRRERSPAATRAGLEATTSGKTRDDLPRTRVRLPPPPPLRSFQRTDRTPSDLRPAHVGRRQSVVAERGVESRFELDHGVSKVELAPSTTEARRDQP